MKNKILETLFLVILILFISVTNSNGFSDELFEFDLPSDYANMSYQGIYAFRNLGVDRGFVIYVMEDSDIKKSVWDIKQSDLDSIVRNISYNAITINTDKRAKLGKEKAVRITLIEDGKYSDVYILASNKYIYLVDFIGESEAELENEDYTMIKKSFKLKDATTDFKALYIIGVIIIIAISAYVKFKKFNKVPTYNNSDNKIDYKNLTENDFNKMP